MGQIAQLSENYRIIITHGNGPQVGNLLLQQESCDSVPKMPLEIIGAMTQGQIGYMIESSLDTALMDLGTDTEHYFVTLITYVVVDENDPAFQNPTKPIGPFYTEAQAAHLRYTLVKTDKGYRRVVASPKPLAIVEQREIKKLIEMDFIVVCTGGGGIPVIRKERKFTGVEAVIDKDLAKLCPGTRNKGRDFFDCNGYRRCCDSLGKARTENAEKAVSIRVGTLCRRKAFPSWLHGTQSAGDCGIFQGHRQPWNHLPTEGHSESDRRENRN